jgi:hypothetical protein
MLGHGENIADDGFGLLIDAKNETDDPIGAQSGEAGQHVIVKVLHQQSRRSTIIPVKSLFPKDSLCLKHWTERGGREMAKIKNFD